MSVLVSAVVVEAVEVAGRRVGDAEDGVMIMESVWTKRSVVLVACEMVFEGSVWVAVDIEKGAVTIMVFVCVDTATVGAKRASTPFSMNDRACEVVGNVVCVETDEVAVAGASVWVLASSRITVDLKQRSLWPAFVHLLYSSDSPSTIPFP